MGVIFANAPTNVSKITTTGEQSFMTTDNKRVVLDGSLGGAWDGKLVRMRAELYIAMVTGHTVTISIRYNSGVNVDATTFTGDTVLVSKASGTGQPGDFGTVLFCEMSWDSTSQVLQGCYRVLLTSGSPTWTVFSSTQVAASPAAMKFCLTANFNTAGDSACLTQFILEQP